MEIKTTLQKPYTDKERMDFIVENNHNKGLRIEETPTGLFALQPWEIINQSGEIEDRKTDWEAEQAELERERIANLHLTRGDVFRGLLRAKGVTRTDIRQLIEEMSDSTEEDRITKEMALIDFDEALEFYRGVSLIDTIGEKLGISSEQMDNFFKSNDWTALCNQISEQNIE